MKNLTEAQSHLYNLLDEELAIMEHPSCSLEEMRSRVVHLVGRLEPYLGCHIDMSQEADLRVISPTAVKELIRYTRSSERSFSEFLACASRVMGYFMTQEERQEFFGEDTK